jgi:hypothetical protein
MTAAVYNFVLEQGTSLNKKLVWKDPNGVAINLTGYTARMQVRESYDSDDVLIELTTTNGKIVITPLTGEIQLIFAPADTADAYWTSGKYDLELVSAGGQVTRLLKGKFKISREVTHD